MVAIPAADVAALKDPSRAAKVGDEIARDIHQQRHIGRVGVLAVDTEAARALAGAVRKGWDALIQASISEIAHLYPNEMTDEQRNSAEARIEGMKATEFLLGGDPRWAHAPSDRPCILFGDRRAFGGQPLSSLYLDAPIDKRSLTLLKVRDVIECGGRSAAGAGFGDLPRPARQALGTRPGDWVGPALAAMVSVAAAAAAFVRVGGWPPRLNDPDAQLVAALICVGGFSLLVLPFLLFRRRRALAEIGRLSRLPFMFDAYEYAASLGSTAPSNELDVTIHFATSPSAHSRERFESLSRAAGIIRIHWPDITTVNMSSKRFVTEARGNTRFLYSNGPVHLCFRRLLAGAVTEIQGAVPVTRVEARCR